MELPTFGDTTGGLLGPDSNYWGSTARPQAFAKDLVATQPDAEQDPFSEWVGLRLLEFLHRHVFDRFAAPLDIESGFVHYSDEHIRRFITIFTSVIAAGLLIGPILVLYRIQSMHLRLAAIAVFLLIFAFSISWFTDARKSEVFEALAA